MGVAPWTYQETFEIIKELNNFSDQMEGKIKTLQMTYKSNKEKMLQKHKQLLSIFDSNSNKQVQNIKENSKKMLADAKKMQSNILNLDEKLSSVDKYYKKTKTKKELELKEVRSDKYEENDNYFDTLENIKKDYEIISNKYSKDILPSLINGINYLFSSKRKKDYEELIILKNTLNHFIVEVEGLLTEFTRDSLNEVNEENSTKRNELNRKNQVELTYLEENYTNNLIQIAEDLEKGFNSILPDELIDYIADIINRYNTSYSKINTGKYIDNGIFYLGNVTYPIDLFIESKTISSFLRQKCEKLINDGSIKFPIVYSPQSSFPIMLSCENSDKKTTEFINSFVYSFLASVPVGRLKISFVDTIDHGNRAEAFFGAKKKLPELFDNKIYTEETEIVDKIQSLNERVESIIQNILGLEHENIFNYIEVNDKYDYCLEILTIYDLPSKLDVRTLSYLNNIIVNGPRCGIYVIIGNARKVIEETSKEYLEMYNKLVKSCIQIQQKGENLSLSGLPYNYNPMPLKKEFDEFFSTYMLRVEAIKNRGIGFSSILKELVDSSSEDEANKNIQIIKQMTNGYNDQYGKVTVSNKSFPKYVVLGTTHYPKQIFESCIGFNKIKENFEDKNNKIELPLILDLSQSSNILINYKEENSMEAISFTHQIIYSMLCSIPASKLNVCVLDNEKKGGNIIPFLELRKKCPEVFDDTLYTNIDSIHERLRKLNDHIDEIIQNKLGSRYKNIIEYNQKFPSSSEPIILLTIYDFPSGLESRSIDILLNILKNGGKCGVYTLLCNNEDIQYTSYDNIESRLEIIKKYCSIINCTSNNYSLLPFNLPITIKDSVTSYDIDPFITEYEKALIDMKNKGLSFEDILDNELFSRASDKLLEIPVGIGDGEQITPIVFGKGSSHHALIAGATGSGKSTLLHTLIMSAMLHYSPDELNLYLMDFKSGTEFKIYDSKPMPHIKLIALDAMQEFGESILENLVFEMTNRSEKFKKEQVSKISEYVKVTGQPMPRILVVMDEFQILFNDASNRKVANNCAELTKRIVTEGRSYGIHLVMATQSTKIITDLTLSSGTIEQMRIRIGLKCGEYDSHYLFTDRNDMQALEMMKGPIGTAVMNPEFTESDNIKFRAVYCDNETQNNMIEHISNQFSNIKCDTQTFEGSKKTPLLEVIHNFDSILDHKPLCVQVGSLIKVAPPLNICFDRRRKHNTLICGANEKMSDNLINLYCFEILLNKYSNVYYIDGEILLGEYDSNAYLEQFSRFGRKFNWAKNRTDIIRYINSIYDFYVEQRKGNSDKQIYLIIKNLQFVDLVKTMFKGDSFDESEYLEFDETSSDFNFDFGGSSDMSISEKMLKLVDDGAAYGIHLIVSCLEYQTVKECMYYGENILSKFPERYIFSLSDSDSDTLVEGISVSSLRDNTVYYSDSVKNIFQIKPYVFPKAEELKIFIDKQFEKEEK